eukprot:4753138-Prymnesium_polylepis.2
MRGIQSPDSQEARAARVEGQARAGIDSRWYAAVRPLDVHLSLLGCCDAAAAPTRKLQKLRRPCPGRLAQKGDACVRRSRSTREWMPRPVDGRHLQQKPAARLVRALGESSGDNRAAIGVAHHAEARHEPRSPRPSARAGDQMPAQQHTGYWRELEGVERGEDDSAGGGEHRRRSAAPPARTRRQPAEATPKTLPQPHCSSLTAVMVAHVVENAVAAADSSCRPTWRKVQHSRTACRDTTATAARPTSRCATTSRSKDRASGRRSAQLT